MLPETFTIDRSQCLHRHDRLAHRVRGKTICILVRASKAPRQRGDVSRRRNALRVLTVRQLLAFASHRLRAGCGEEGDGSLITPGSIDDEEFGDVRFIANHGRIPDVHGKRRSIDFCAILLQRLWVSTGPVDEHTAMSSTIPLTGSNIVATAAAVTTCSASADCTDSATPTCSGDVCVTISYGGGNFTPVGAYDSLWDNVRPVWVSIGT